ncbi:MAG: helix-turn-helix transcriptional regulator [Chloroflexota bacterium]|nr:helix-turn-helix transcriptional regulator [Chloroflexota bacterium]
MQRRLPALSAKEQRVLVLLGRGYATREIATELGMRRSTAEKYVNRVIDFVKQRGRAHAGEQPRLTARESQVVEMVRQGWTDRQVAAALGLSVRTVETHVARILRKFGLNTRRALIADQIGSPAQSIRVPIAVDDSGSERLAGRRSIPATPADSER